MSSVAGYFLTFDDTVFETNFFFQCGGTNIALRIFNTPTDTDFSPTFPTFYLSKVNVVILY